ncbi:hypothetical protein VTN77DRAFT_7746 [Rasamsonia byssochlamydoides]|uniref:uncharacterized protein n=1 Tax=Rasamsonia byssochlamydoides TaxID=89139 RepID=UPI0037438586
MMIREVAASTMTKAMSTAEYAEAIGACCIQGNPLHSQIFSDDYLSDQSYSKSAAASLLHLARALLSKTLFCFKKVEYLFRFHLSACTDPNLFSQSSRQVRSWSSSDTYSPILDPVSRIEQQAPARDEQVQLPPKYPHHRQVVSIQQVLEEVTMDWVVNYYEFKDDALSPDLLLYREVDERHERCLHRRTLQHCVRRNPWKF